MSYTAEIGTPQTGTIQAATAVTAWSTTGNKSYITAAGATFVTNGVREGDVLRLGDTAPRFDINTGWGSAASYSGGEYLDLTTLSRTYRLWNDKDGTATPPASPGGSGLLIRVSTITGESATTVRIKFRDKVRNLGGWLAANNLFLDVLSWEKSATPTITHSGLGLTITNDIAGVSATANDGNYIVSDVISETQIEVYGVIPFTGAVAGNVDVQENNSVIIVQDETTPSFTAMSAALPIVCKFNDYSTTSVVTKDMFEVFASILNLDWTTAVSATWDIKDEIVIFRHTRNLAGAVGSSGNIQVLDTSTNRPGTDITFNIGTVVSDTFGGSEGSLLIGANFTIPLGSDYITVKAHGSALLPPENVFFDLGQDGSIGGSYIGSGLAPNFNTGSTGAKVNTVLIVSNSFGIVPLDNIDEFDNLTNVSNSGFSFGIGGVGTIGGFLLSDQSQSPYLFTFGNTAFFLNPKEDYTAAELVDPFLKDPGETWHVEKRYTWNPTFVTRDDTGLTGTPLSGLRIDLERINIETPIDVVSAGPIGTTYTVTITMPGVVGSPFVANYVSINTSITTIRNNLASAINTAVGANGTATAPSSGIFDPYASDIIFRPTDEDQSYTVDLTDDDTGSRLAIGTGFSEVETVPGSPFTTDSNGQINSGDGVNLQRMVVGGPDAVYHFTRKHRVTISGPDTRRLIQIFAITSKQVFDYPVDLQAPDLEGELTI